MTTSNVITQKKRKEKKRGATLLATLLPRKRKKEVGQRCYLRKREERKKRNLNWGYLCKVHLSTLFSPHFPPKPNWEDKKRWVWSEKFPPYSLSLLFSLLNQTMENAIFHHIFLFLFSILPIFTPTKHTLKVQIKE